jgi:hypothetical protein
VKFFIVCLTLLSSAFIFGSSKKNDDVRRYQSHQNECKCDGGDIMTCAVCTTMGLVCLAVFGPQYYHRHYGIVSEIDCTRPFDSGTCKNRYYRMDHSEQALCQRVGCLHEAMCCIADGKNESEVKKEIRDCQWRQFSHASSNQVQGWLLAAAVAGPVARIMD